MLRWLTKDPTAGRDSLGPLEARLLRALWRRGDATVRELIVPGEIDAAYTTVMTTLDRLYKKGLLDRVADGPSRAFRYRPRQTQQEFFRALMGDGLSHLLSTGKCPSLPISFLVDAISEHDTTLLDELTRAINRKKRDLRRKERS